MYKSNSKPMHVACVLIRPPPKYSSQDLPTLQIVDVVIIIIIVVDLIVSVQKVVSSSMSGLLVSFKLNPGASPCPLHDPCPATAVQLLVLRLSQYGNHKT